MQLGSALALALALVFAPAAAQNCAAPLGVIASCEEGTCTFSCIAGETLVGDRSAACPEGGSFTFDTTPSCHPKCASFATLLTTNGLRMLGGSAALCGNADGTLIDHGATCTVSCKPGLSFFADPNTPSVQSTCEDGEWSVLPRCVDHDHCAAGTHSCNPATSVCVDKVAPEVGFDCVCKDGFGGEPNPNGVPDGEGCQRFSLQTIKPDELIIQGCYGESCDVKFKFGGSGKSRIVSVTEIASDLAGAISDIESVAENLDAEKESTTARLQALENKITNVINTNVGTLNGAISSAQTKATSDLTAQSATINAKIDQVNTGLTQAIDKAVADIKTWALATFYNRAEADNKDSATRAWATGSFPSKADLSNLDLTVRNWANGVFLGKTDASSLYFSKSDATGFLSRTEASNTYITKNEATNAYLSKSDASNDYATKTALASQDAGVRAWVNGNNYATQGWVNSNNFATQGWVANNNFATQAWVNANLNNYVPTSTYNDNKRHRFYSVYAANHRRANGWAYYPFNVVEHDSMRGWITNRGDNILINKAGYYRVDAFAIVHSCDWSWRHSMLEVNGVCRSYDHQYELYWNTVRLNYVWWFNAGDYVRWNIYLGGGCDPYHWHSGNIYGQHSRFTISFVGDL